MSAAAEHAGGCSCGAVRYRASGAPLWVAHCHCRDCQKNTGAPLATYAGFAREAAGVEIEAFVFFTPDSLGETGPGWYGSIELSKDLGKGISLVAGYGVSRFDNDQLNDDYDDWRLMLEKPLFGFDLKLRYSDTVGALGPDNRTLSLIIERPFGLMTRSEADAGGEKIRNRFIIDKCRLMTGR